MSIFASKTTVTIPVAHDPPHEVTIRKLRGREMEQAQAAHMREFVAGRSPRAWAGTLRSALAKGIAAESEVRAGIQDPLLGFDRYVIVKAGLLAWTYDGGTPTDEQIEDLDDDSVDLFAREILRLSKPALFLSAEEAQKETAAPAPRAGGAGAAAA